MAGAAERCGAMEGELTLCALALNVLGAHASPEDVVVGELSPVARDLDGLAKAEWVEEREHLERDLPREECERVEPDELVRLGREHRELTRKGRAARSSATETY